jgi:hypothetical protein
LYPHGKNDGSCDDIFCDLQHPVKPTRLSGIALAALI